MLFLPNLRKKFWCIYLDTDENYIGIHQLANPFVDTEAGMEIYVENLIKQAQRRGLRVRRVDVYPLAYREKIA